MNKPNKHTELPSGWGIKRLFEFASVKRGAGSQYLEYVNKDEECSIRLIRITDFISDNPAFIKNNKDINRFLLEEGDLLIAGTGATAGISFEVPSDFVGMAFSYNAPKIKVSSVVDKKYIVYALKSNSILKQQYALFTGNAQPFLDTKAIESFKIPLPPLPEQRAIANILSTWDTAIQTTQALISQKEQEKKWLMQNLLTGKKRFKGFENTKWKKVGAGEVFESFTKKGFENEELLSATQDRGIIPRSMLEGRVTMPDGSTSGYKLVEPGDFIISLRSFQGGLEYSYYRGIVSPAYIVLKPKLKINDEFYKQYFKSYEFIGRLATAVIGIRDGKQISYDDFCIVKIPCPSIEEQTAIAQVLQTADKEIELLKSKLEKQKLQKKGLMQVLLTGKVRVKLN